MTARGFDPYRLDVEAFARDDATLDGRWPLLDLDRVTDSAPAEARPGPEAVVNWQVRGERRPLRGGDAQTWLHLTADAHIALECQRCLKPVDVALKVHRSVLFVPGEDTAAQIDADSEDDVLAMTRALDLRELIEDELLLAMPLVPRHDVCPEPLAAPPDDVVIEEAPNPFAALASLKKGQSLN